MQNLIPKVSRRVEFSSFFDVNKEKIFQFLPKVVNSLSFIEL